MKAVFRWPDTAKVDREIPKERLYREGSVSASVRRRFIEEVQRVRWAYKLGEESVHLRGTDEVREIQVFEVELKGQDISNSVLASIDKAVPSPIIFELHSTSAGESEVQYVAALKRRGQRTASVGDYLRGGWVPEPDDREPLPTAIDLPRLYHQLMSRLLPIEPRCGEDLADSLSRLAGVRRLERDIDSLSARMQREPQFNRKVALRQELRIREAELATLLDPTTTAGEDRTWKS